MDNLSRYVSLALIVIFGVFGLSRCSKEKSRDNAGPKMQDFVIDISKYAKDFDSDFIVIPQNGIELAYNYLDINDGLNTTYMDAIDGFGVEELFYDGSYSIDNERLDLLEGVKSMKQVLVAEYIINEADVEDAILRNTSEGFICFPRVSNNYDYLNIPNEVINENNNDITSLQDVQNYLYLISTDNFASKQAMLDAIAATNFDLILIDLFFNEEQLGRNDVQQLKIKANGGKRLVISYMNIGAAESYRYYWQDKWKLHRPGWLKKRYDGYEDEIWVKFWKDEWRSIIFGNKESYTKRVIDSGFDGVYLDNVEAYYFLYFD